MKFPQLNSLVPAGEHFDESAINEGVYLTVAHVTGIENSLAVNASVLAAMQTKVDEAAVTITTHDATIAGLNIQAATDKTTIDGLQARLDVLEAKASGKGSVVTAPAATEVVTERTDGKVSFDSAEHPANKFADSQKGYQSGLPAKK